MHCELLVPALLSAPAATRLPAMELLLARARCTSGRSQPAERWLLDEFEVDGEALPVGALTLLAEERHPGNAAWVRADPVHLRMMRERVVVVPADAFEISPEEAQALAEALSRHFAGELELCAVQPSRWCARLDLPLDPATPSPLEEAGRDVQRHLPRQADALQRLLNEAQMLLHSHPANEVREARGEPEVNSLWFWGAGTLPGGAHSRWRSVTAHDPVALGLARLAGTPVRRLPDSADAWLQGAPEEGRHLIVLDSLRAPCILSPGEDYRSALEALERDWFAPLLEAVRGGRVGMVSVHVPDAAESLSFEAIRSDLRRFWRRARPLERYA